MFTCIWIDENGEQHSTFHDTKLEAEYAEPDGGIAFIIANGNDADDVETWDAI